MDRPWFTSYEPRVPRSIEIPDVTLNYFLAESTRKYPYNTATNFVLSYLARRLLTVGGKMTYQKLNEMVDRFANALYQLGVRKGDRVALMLPNSPHYVIAFFAAMRIGAIIVNNNPTYTARELKHQLVDSGAETIILLNLFYPRLQEIRAETPLKRVIVAHVFDTLGPLSRFLVHAKQSKQPEWVDVSQDKSIYLFQHLLERYGPNPPAVEVVPDDTALLQYTGGTTGLPKAAMLSHRNLVANTLQVASWLTDTNPGAEKMMCAIPFFHVYGMTVAMIFGLYLGGELTIVPNPRELDHVMDVIQHERSSLFPGVPAMYIRIVNHPRISEYDLKSVKACISGSAPLPIEVQEQFGQITGGRLVEGFGMTELSPVSHCNPVFGTRKKGSIGIPLPDVDAKIVDLETGEDIPFGSDKEGELLVRGPMVMQGYWNRPDETAVTITPDGWLRTGDICKVDSDGYFYIVDRKKDMMIASGYKVLPRDVEEVLFTHPKVLEAVVVGIPHPTRGDDTVKAFIVLKPGVTATADEIRDFCKQQLAPYKVPREVEFRDELPKTMVGKVLRRVLIDEEKAKLAVAGEPKVEAVGAKVAGT
ncbi:MAG: long-chain fatty acid--CoA ligase [Chloroflexi bacterium]|nr:long-chain fatty acid--CoA ligase [Chloroflexota bacterium]